MNIRAITPEDIREIKKIHEAHFSSEFDFEEFRSHFLGYFVVEDEQGIISAGGVRTIAENVLVTNLDRSVRDRKLALVNVLQTSMFIASRHGYDQLHAFVQDSEFEKHLHKVGFRGTKGKSLVMDV